jgi:hypothetical protein
MTLRPFLTPALAMLAAAALPALAQAPAPAQTQTVVIPPHNCVAPEYPSKPGLQLRGDAYNRAVEAFNRANKAYGECIKKYVDDTRTWAKAAVDAGNNAIDQYNKYNEDVKQKIEAEKD